jgi:hypothetical protein
VVIATHTHGGPMSMPGRGGGDADPAFLQQLEDGCVEAIRLAAAHRQPARLSAGNGANPGIAFNRRRDGGPIDPTVPVLRVEAEDGTVLAVAFAHGCHPVVLSAGNRLYTADFPYYARAAVEAAHPGAVALFLPGASGDVSTGHSPESSISTDAPPDRTYAEAERLGTKLAQSVLAASLTPLSGGVSAHVTPVELALARTETGDLDALSREWLAMADTATANAIRAAMPPGLTPFVLSLSDGNPGYIPAREDFPAGGYEVAEAHRYYGLPAAFGRGSAEVLVDAAIELRSR